MPFDIGEKAVGLSAAEMSDHVKAESQKAHVHQHAGDERDLAIQMSKDENPSRADGAMCHPCCTTAFGICAALVPEPHKIPDMTIISDHTREVVNTVQIPSVAPLPHPPKSNSA